MPKKGQFPCVDVAPDAYFLQVNIGIDKENSVLGVGTFSLFLFSVFIRNLFLFQTCQAITSDINVAE